MPLVLNTQTANVTPQFHCIYDDEFDTCKRDAKFESLWQYKAKITTEKLDAPLLDILPTSPENWTNVHHTLPRSSDPPPMFSVNWECSVPNPLVDKSTNKDQNHQNQMTNNPSFIKKETQLIKMI